MRNTKISKIAIILVAVMMFNVCTVFASTRNPMLTIESAVSLAIANSAELKKLNFDATTNEEQEIRALDNYFDSTSVTAYYDYEVTRMQQSLTKALTEQNKTKRKELIEFSITDYFTSILQLEMEFDQFKKSLELQEAEFKITEVRRQLGMISELDYKNAKLTYDKNINAQKNYEESLESLYRSLNRMLGEDVDNKYTLAYAVEYKELGEFNMTSHITKVKANDSTLKQIETNKEVAQFSIDNYLGRNHNPLTGEILQGNPSQEELKRNLQQYDLDKADRNKVIEDTLKSKHDNILTQERQYREKLVDLENLKNELEVKKVQLELGKITKLNLDNHEFSILKLQNEIKTLVYQHRLNIMEFTNINLVA